MTGLRVDSQSGTLLELANHTFGDGSPLTVTIEDDGDVLLASGSVQVSEPADQFVTEGTLRYLLKNLVLSPSGASADLALLLPAGLGWTPDPDLTRIWESELVYEGIPLSNQFTPTETLLTTKGTRWFTEESKPVLFETNKLEWDLAQSRLTLTTTGQAAFVREEELNQLLNDIDLPEKDRTKRSNDHVFRSINGVNGPVVVATDANGTARLTAEFTFSKSRRTSSTPRLAR